MKILFLHGWHSVPGGVKPTYLREHGHEVINPKLDHDDFELAIKTAQAEYDLHQPDMIVGSSRGGAVAMNIESKQTPMVLLCPAWRKWGSVKKLKPNSMVLHSRKDDVIAFEDSEELVLKSGLAPKTLVEVGSDHRLADSDSLSVLGETLERITIKCFGIDPASSKGLMVSGNNGTHKQSAKTAKTWIANLLKTNPNVLICWDSPLSFSPTFALSDRPVEKVLRMQVDCWVKNGLVERNAKGKKAVSVQPFSGCSHWVISCEAVGQPFCRVNDGPIPIAQSNMDVRNGGAWLIETHPAVAMAIWWIAEKVTGAFPIYKQRPDTCKKIAKTLGFQELIELESVDDDTLDAYVAYRLAHQFLAGKSRWIGDSTFGGFVLPSIAEEIWQFNSKIEAIKRKNLK